MIVIFFVREKSTSSLPFTSKSLQIGRYSVQSSFAMLTDVSCSRDLASSSNVGASFWQCPDFFINDQICCPCFFFNYTNVTHRTMELKLIFFCHKCWANHKYVLILTVKFNKPVALRRLRGEVLICELDQTLQWGGNHNALIVSCFFLGCRRTELVVNELSQRWKIACGTVFDRLFVAVLLEELLNR